MEDEKWKQLEVISDLEKRELLQKEVAETTERLNNLRNVARSLRADASILQTEADQLEKDNHNYLKYLEKKLEEHHNELQSVREKAYQEIMTTEKKGRKRVLALEEEKKQLEEEIIQKEAKLGKAKTTLTELKPYRKQESDQERKIKGLNKELSILRHEHDEAIQKQRNEFAREREELKESYRKETEQIRNVAENMIGPLLEEKLTKLLEHNKTLQKKLTDTSDRTMELMRERDRLIKEKNYLTLNKDVWDGLTHVKLDYSPSKTSRQVPEEFVQKMKSLETCGNSSWFENALSFA